MDNSWQSQCGSMWQSSTPTPVASTQFQLQESLNQMLNAGHHFYPRIVQEPNSSGRGMMLEPSFTCTSNLNFYNSGHAELGNSFLSLLSGPPSLLQCDLQQLPNPKPFITSSKDPVNGSSAAGSGVSPTGLLSHNLDNWNLKTGVDLCPVVSSRAVASAYSGGASCLHDVLQAAHLNVQSSEHAKAVIHHNFNGIEKVKDFSPMRGRGLASPSPAHAGKLHSTSILASQKVPLETNSPVPCQSSPLTSGCPRVFCLGASGDLLLSNTGLLGVVCSCHGLHMSISKFSEHSGLRDVNPGDAVHMDNGETIAQWRKDYFHKFGIRVPEDHSGWNWPEGFSAAAGIASNSSRSSDLSKLGGPSGALVASGQQWNNNVISNNPHTGQKLVNEILHSEKPRTAQHSWNFFNSFSGTSQSNVHAVADNQIMDCPMSGCATVSKLVGLRGSDNGSQSISTYIDSISKSGSSFIPLPHLQNLKTSCKDSDVVRFNNLKVGDIVDRATISSNIELRLGQPSQQSQTLGNSIVPAFGSHVIGTHDHHPQKSLPLETLIPNRNYRAMEEGRKQYLQCAAGIPKSSTRREQRQFNIVNHSSGVYSAMDSAQTEQFRGDAARGSVISTLFSHLKRPAEGKMQPKATNNVVDGSHVIPGKLPCNSHILKYDPNNFLQNRGKGTETQFNVNELGIHKQMDIGKGVGCAADGAHVASESNFGFHTNYKGSLSSSSGVIGETGRYTCSVARNKSSQSYQLTEMPINASATRNPFNSVGKNSCLGRNGQLDHGFLRSVNFPMDSAPIFPSKAVSKEFSSTTSVSVPNQTPTLSANREGIDVSPYLLNENLRMLALRNMLELSNQDHAISSLGTSQEQRGFKNSRVDKIEGCIAGPSTSTERSLGFDLSSKQDASEVVMKSLKSGVTHWMSGDVKKLAPVADIEMQCQLSRDPHPNEQPLLRLGRSENDITPSNEHGKCGHQVPYAYFQGKCSCAVHTNCSGENCDFKGKTSLSAFQERAGSVGGRASMLFPSNLDGNCTFSKDKAISISQSGLLRMQNSKKVECHAFQWRDVPNKVTGICNVTCKDRPADLMDGRGSVEDQFAAAAKCFNRSAQGAESLKEQELSNISSGCSAPAITQASVKANNGDSCTVDARDSRRANNLVVDEGSGIDKCWSSDDALDSERSTEFKGFACKINSINKGSSKPFPNQSSRSLIDELRLRDSLRSKKTPNQIHTGLSNKEKTNHMQKTEGGFKTGKRKKATKWKMLDASFPTSGVSSGHNESPRCTTSSEQHSHSSKDVQMLLRPDQGRSHNCACSAEPSFKRRRSEMSSYKTISHKRNLHRLYDNREVEVDCQTQLSVDDNCLEVSEASHGKRFRSDRAAPTIEQVWRQEPNCSDDEITVKCNSVDCTRTSIQKVNVCKKKAKPVVCGKYGIISNGNTSKPAKILSIRKILKTARKCTLAKKDKLKLTKAKELKNIRNRGNNGCSNKFTNYKEERPREGQDGAAYGEVDPDDYAEKTAAVCFPGGKGHDDVSYMLEKERYDRSEKDHSIPDGCPSTGLKPKIKDVCKRSLNELTIKGKDSCCANIISMKNSNCVPKTKSSYLGKFIENAESGKSHASEVYDANKSTGYKLPSMSDLDAFCCVCGGSNKDEINCLLECNLCLIKVHQACYGVSKVPKAHWYCRPCRTSSKNIVCVLCGYGGGAMTRALQSHNIVKTLLKYWNFETEFVPKNPTSPTESLEDQLNIMPSSLSGPESDSLPVIRPVLKMDLQKHLDSSVKDSSYAPSNSMVHNSITAGVRDSTIKQWVHMVCGLWTPGTRCPNVDTMSSFDVSGASRPKVDVVCSICNRPGGSCIQCRVVDCSVQFHPWCAHQKGLLQSEVEGVDNENVGFYGRCELHATQHHCNSVSVPCDTGTGHPGEKELTCARTEGYKGRKREGFRHNIPRQSDGSSGCLVPQDQLNAWLHINGLKSCTKGPPKLPASDVEYDCRKEYARYKQLKGWKHLVVYKSGIHALGLYTSRFISRGAMVVEYVGEIVGLRVADKREIEYQSGRKLQYKSACYFFRIDKEHIIDATCKGGIARFVNHSCLPNCVAKIISVRNEKKVVFFAERDIYPGEEITYDYHFNNEDEGKKIPCFCNSKNCRRYLN